MYMQRPHSSSAITMIFVFFSIILILGFSFLVEHAPSEVWVFRGLYEYTGVWLKFVTINQFGKHNSFKPSNLTRVIYHYMENKSLGSTNIYYYMIIILLIIILLYDMILYLLTRIGFKLIHELINIKFQAKHFGFLEK